MRSSGKAFEAVVAAFAGRPRLDLYHSALLVRCDGADFAIEMTPVPDENGVARGVAGEGAVGNRWVRRLRIFRYESRCWPGGSIPDLAEAVDSPIRLTEAESLARRVVELVPLAPSPVWGRDELATGEMWNSNSLISWLLVRSGIGVDGVSPPAGGRAPGWRAGVVAAQRHGAGDDGLRQASCL